MIQLNLKNRILFCYFISANEKYCPLDLGYIIAGLKNNKVDNYEYQLKGLSVKTKVDISELIVDDISCVLLSTENIQWSGMFHYGLALEYCKMIKEAKPDIMVGIQSYKMQEHEIEEALKNGVDFIITGEPERVLLRIEDILNNEIVNGCRTLKNSRDDIKRSIEDRKKIEHQYKDLDNIPSPYLNGVMDDFLNSLVRRYGTGVEVFLAASRGCNFGCEFCYRSIKFENVRYFSPKRFYDEIEYNVKTFDLNNFFMVDDAFLTSEDRLKAFLHEFKLRCKNDSRMENIKLFNAARPESINENNIKVIKELNVNRIQIGLQTVNPSIQHYMNRKISVDRIKEICNIITSNGIELYLDVIIGLPGDTIEYLEETIQTAIDLKPSLLQVKRLYLNPFTKFHRDQREYGISIYNNKSKFRAPLVEKAIDLDENYFSESEVLLERMIKDNPDTYWKYIGYNHFALGTNATLVSRDYYGGMNYEPI